jgi:uncharacterized protein
MEMRHLLLPAAALAVAGTLAGCGGGHKADPRGLDRDETLLSLSAMGEAETVPDEAGIEVGVESYAPTAQAASAAVAKKGEAIAAALAKFDVAAKDIQTRNLSISRVEYGKFKGQFQANNILGVRLTNVAKAGEAVAAATDAGANVLSGPSLRIADPEKANRGAYIAAYRAARTRAEAYAEAAGMEISRVLTIRDGGQSGMPMPMAYAEQARDASAPAAVSAQAPSIRPGTSRMQVSVQVDFALEPK